MKRLRRSVVILLVAGLQAPPILAASPEAPADLQVGSGRVAPGGPVVANLWWTPGTEMDLKEYLVLRATDADALASSRPVVVATVPAEGGMATDSGLAEDATYYYALVAVNLGGERSAPSPAMRAWPTGASVESVPPPVTSLVAVAAPGNVLNLIWAAHPDGACRDYRIFRSTVSGRVGARRLIATVAAPGTTHEDPGLTNDVRYYYQIVSRSQRLMAGEPGAEVRGVPVDLLPPAVPSGLRAADVPDDEGTALRLAWTANTESDLKMYRLFRGLSSGGIGFKSCVASLAAPGTTHQDEGLMANTLYYYQLTALDLARNESAGSVEATASPVDGIAPAPPAGLTVADVPGDRGSTLQLGWAANTERDLKDYRIFRGLSSGGVGSKSVVATIAAPGSSHRDAGLVVDTTYYYQLTARDTSLNESAPGGEAGGWPADNTRVEPPAAKPPAPPAAAPAGKPEDPLTKKRELFERGQQAFKNKEYGVAIAAWEEVLKMDPDHEPSRSGLARAKAAQGKGRKP